MLLLNFVPKIDVDKLFYKLAKDKDIIYILSMPGYFYS